MKLYDISQPVGPATAVWPGDEPFHMRWTARQEEGASVNVAAIALSVHTGTHVDGPLHLTTHGAPAGALPLEPLIGPALVVEARGRELLDEDVVAEVDLGAAQRVLFRTRTAVDPTEFPARFAALSPALARRLAAAGVRLVGTDAPSVDPVDSTTLDAHRILAEGGAAIVENLVLADVPAGRYTLLVLPLKLVEADSAPARAVLIEGELQ